MALRTLDENSDWVKQGDVVSPKGAEATAAFRGLQADLNFFADKVGFDLVEVDGKLGPKTMSALRATYEAAIEQNLALTGTLAAPGSVEQTATHALQARQWLDTTARGALGVGEVRRYHQGAGKEWNVKDQIAYGAGPVHQDFQRLQEDVNRFAGKVGFAELKVDGFLGQKSVAAVQAIYQAVVKQNPLLAGTPFPVPDTKEEVAEYAAFIRHWLDKVATRALLAEAGA